jgi:hypothetical protein
MRIPAHIVVDAPEKTIAKRINSMDYIRDNLLKRG